MHLTSINDRVRFTLTAIGDIDAHCSWIEQPASGNPVVKRKNVRVTAAATPTDLNDALPAGSAGKIKFICLYNDHASSDTELTVEHTDGTTAVKIDVFTISPKAKWTYGSEADV